MAGREQTGLKLCGVPEIGDGVRVPEVGDEVPEVRDGVPESGDGVPGIRDRVSEVGGWGPWDQGWSQGRGMGSLRSGDGVPGIRDGVRVVGWGP